MKNSASRTLIFLSLMITAVAVLVSTASQSIDTPEPKAVTPVSLTQGDTALININTADVDTLTKLSGIGAVKAQAIIDFRTKNGYFVTPEDIMRVDGIGQTTFERIKNHITV